MTITSMYSHYHNIQPPPHNTFTTSTTTQCKLQHVPIIFVSVQISKCTRLQGRTPPAQVAAGDDHHECVCKCSIYNIDDGRKNTISTSCAVSRPSWAQLWSGMQQTNAGNTENAPTALIVSNVPHSKVSPCAYAATVLTYVTAKSSYIVPTWASCT